MMCLKGAVKHRKIKGNVHCGVSYSGSSNSQEGASCSFSPSNLWSSNVIIIESSSQEDSESESQIEPDTPFSLIESDTAHIDDGLEEVGFSSHDSDDTTDDESYRRRSSDDLVFLILRLKESKGRLKRKLDKTTKELESVRKQLKDCEALRSVEENLPCIKQQVQPILRKLGQLDTEVVQKSSPSLMQRPSQWSSPQDRGRKRHRSHHSTNRIGSSSSNSNDHNKRKKLEKGTAEFSKESGVENIKETEPQYDVSTIEDTLISSTLPMQSAAGTPRF